MAQARRTRLDPALGGFTTTYTRQRRVIYLVMFRYLWTYLCFSSINTFTYQYFSFISTFQVSILFKCQHFPSTNIFPVSILFMFQKYWYFSSINTFKYQHCFKCQFCSGITMNLCSLYLSSSWKIRSTESRSAKMLENLSRLWANENSKFLELPIGLTWYYALNFLP